LVFTKSYWKELQISYYSNRWKQWDTKKEEKTEALKGGNEDKDRRIRCNQGKVTEK